MPKKINRKALRLAPVFHIYCEGAKTEPGYLQRYKELCCCNKPSIKIEKTKKNTPVQLVKEAVAQKRQSPKGVDDIFWVVYDRESEVKYPESLHEQARALASANGISIALSNVCFEVWLLLHKQPTCAHCNNCDELIHRDDFKRAFPDYDKGSPCLLDVNEIASARERAVVLNANTIAGANREWDVPSKWNPYTDVYKLLDAIDSFLKGCP